MTSHYGGRIPDGWWCGDIESWNPASQTATTSLACGLYGDAAERAVAACEAENVGDHERVIPPPGEHT